jgi:hypothetical protein
VKRFAVLLVAFAVLGGCSEADEEQRPRGLRAEGPGLTVELPPGWARSEQSLTPTLSDPVEVLSVGTFPLGYRPGGQDNMPADAIEDMGPRDTLISLQQRKSEGAGFRWSDFPPRPKHFGAEFAGKERGEWPDRRAHWFTFSHGGRAFHALVVFGAETSPAARDAGWRVLDSLRVHAQVAFGRGLSAELPSGWQQAEKRLTPQLTDPREVLSLGTFPLHAEEGECGHMPTGALEDLGPSDAFVTLQERGRGGGASLDFPPRPERFGPDPGDRSEARDCVPGARFTDHWFGFSDAGRRFHVLVAFGPEATQERRAEAWRALDSLRIDPGLRPDWDNAG